jgi:hypothetical protein
MGSVWTSINDEYNMSHWYSISNAKGAEATEQVQVQHELKKQ